MANQLRHARQERIRMATENATLADALRDYRARSATAVTPSSSSSSNTHGQRMRELRKSVKHLTWQPSLDPHAERISTFLDAYELVLTTEGATHDELLQLIGPRFKGFGFDWYLLLMRNPDAPTTWVEFKQWRRTSTNRSCRSGRQTNSCAAVQRCFTRRTTNTWCASTDASKTCRSAVSLRRPLWPSTWAVSIPQLLTSWSSNSPASRSTLFSIGHHLPRRWHRCLPGLRPSNGPGRSLHDALRAVPRNHPSSRQQQSQPRHSWRLRYSQHQPRSQPPCLLHSRG